MWRGNYCFFAFNSSRTIASTTGFRISRVTACNISGLILASTLATMSSMLVSGAFEACIHGGRLLHCIFCDMLGLFANRFDSRRWQRCLFNLGLHFLAQWWRESIHCCGRIFLHKRFIDLRRNRLVNRSRCRRARCRNIPCRCKPACFLRFRVPWTGHR